MCSTQFEFLDLSNIKEEDYQELVGILEERTEICLPSGDSSPSKDVKEEEEESEKKLPYEEEDFISQANRDGSASGISFFFDGGTADDIDPTKTPPIISSSETPPQSDSPSTLCNDQDDIPAEEPMEMYPPPHTPQTPYMNQPPPMVPTMNVHSIPTSGAALFNMPPPYPPHSTPGGIHNGMYPLPPGHAHSHIVPHTVHIENCHVNLSNLSPYGTPQPPGNMYASQPPPPQYQGTHHPQVFQQFLLADQSPMSMPVKPTSDKDHEYKRHDVHGRGSYRGGRGRGRGRRRGRDDHERSNSVSSDHSSYSDSGSKGHYKDGPSQPIPPSHYPLVQYSHYVPYQVNHMRSHQGFPMMPSQFLQSHYSPDPSHVIAYSAQPPASVAIISNDNSNQLPRHSECVPIMMAPSTVPPQVTSMSSHSTYIVTSGYENSPQYDGSQYSYCNIEESNIDSTPQNILSSTSDQQLYSSNVVQTPNASNNDKVVQVVESVGEQVEEKIDPQINSLEKNVSNIKIEQNENAAPENIVHPSNSEKSELENREFVNSTLAVENIRGKQSNSQIKSSSFNVVNSQSIEKTAKVVTVEKNVKNKLQMKHQSNSQKSQDLVETPVVNASVILNSSVSAAENSHSPVPSNSTSKKKENGSSSKSKHRKNSPHNKDNNPLSLPPLVPPTKDKENIKNIVPSAANNDKTKSPLQPMQHIPKVSKSNSGVEENKKSEVKVAQNQMPSPVEVVSNSSLSETEVKTKVNSRESTTSVDKLAVNNSSSLIMEPQNITVSPTKPSEVAWGQKMSWSQLFKSNEEFSTKQVALVSPFNAKEANESNGSAGPSTIENGDINISDSEAEKAKVGNHLKKYVPDYRPVLLQPRGLINKNYWCYVNAPLQALLACPSFYQLTKSLSAEAGYKTGNVSTPFINSIVDFVSEFTPMSAAVKQTRKEKNASKKEPEVVPGPPFEPTCVYKMLCNYKKDQFAEGRQQDAEEMLSCVLNGLHDEMVESLKLTGSSDTTPNGVAVGDRNGADHDVSEDENEWKVQGPKKKSYVTRAAHFNSSPISEIFWGQLRSVLQQAGGNTTANLQPFNTLPLDIQSPKVDTLKDALGKLVMREEISGFTCPKTNQEVTASNQVMFEDLPRVLILQLKRFIYDNGGLQKVTKRLQFPIDLDITKDLISPNNRGKFNSSQRRYKLFAIVNHEGKEATKGHYVADVFHNGYNCWLRYDDSSVKSIPENVVLRHEPPRVPYLLFYRRSDTLAYPMNGNASNNSSANGKASK